MTPEEEKGIRDDASETWAGDGKYWADDCKILLAEIDRLRQELDKYTTHDHAPCMFCDPLRQQVAELRQENEALKRERVEVRQAKQALAPADGSVNK